MTAQRADRQRRWERRAATVRAAAAIGIAVLTFGLFGALPAAADGPTTFANTAAIAIPASGSPGQSGVADPYPSTVDVSGMSGLVSAVTVTLHDMTHSVLSDVEAMLVAPSGRNIVLLSDRGILANGATLTFSDAATAFVPPVIVDSGTYRPTGVGFVDFPSPAPPPSAEFTLAGAFNGTDPNGEWRLFVFDDALGDVGSMAGGWSLSITTEVAASTATTVTTSGTPTTTGDPVTFTATVLSGASPVTDGEVQFTDGVTAFGAPIALDATGVAVLETSQLSEGTHQIHAVYSGASGFIASTGSVSQRVDNATVVTGDTYCNPGAITVPHRGVGSPYPSTITVTGATGSIVAVTASLKGFAHEFPVDLDIMLSGPSPTTNLLLMSDVGGNVAVTDVDLTFDDEAASGLATPIVDGTFLPTNATGDDLDEFPAPAPPVSSATTLATFAGTDPNGTWSLWLHDVFTGHVGDIAGGWCLTILTQQATSTSLTSSLNPSTAGDSVTFTATVTSGGDPVTAGTVQFADGATALGAPVPVATDGTATLVTSALAVGSHPVTATYSGTTGFGGSVGSITQVVERSATFTSLTSSQNPSSAGDSVTFTATVVSGGGPVTSGTVTFADGGVALGAPVPLAADGTATVATSALAVGTHPMTATYSGTASFFGSDGFLNQVVEPVVVADAGGPYTVAEGDDLVLDGSASSPGAMYEWDVNGDGDFSDATGIAPTLTWTQLEALGIDDGPASVAVSLRVTIGSTSRTDAAVLDVVNTAPASVVTGELTATAGTPFTLKVGADDPSSADMAALFTYTVDWGDGSPIESVEGPADPPVTHTYAAAGTFRATFTATDKDGGTGEGTVVEVEVAPAATPSPTPTPPAAGLPPTGVDASGPLLIAAGLLLFGAMLLLVRRLARRA